MLTKKRRWRTLLPVSFQKETGFPFALMRRSVWIDEYVVANGGLVKTGKSLITQQAITDIIQMIYNDTAGQSHGANLFDRDKAKEGAFINELGGLSDNAAYFASDRIPVLSN
ncbi:hypothetical protein ACYB0D_29310, partial [Klebsiella pneumoniae]